MIEKIYLANEGPYDASGIILDDLKKINYFFGSNGSGKTTISRAIDRSTTSSGCKLSWAGDSPLETRVYNKDFIENYFDAESNIKGIYTFGENVEIIRKIKILNCEEDEIKDKLLNLKKTLNGEYEVGGKLNERAVLELQFIDDLWDAKKKLENLKDAFTGVNNNKANFRDRYLVEASRNTSNLRGIAELQKEANKVYSSSLVRATTLTTHDDSEILRLEKAAILKKKIIGKDDVDIAALIEELRNSDWVQEGRKYFEKLEDQCPFCQQKTDAKFKQSIEAYFDESYVADLATIDHLTANYSKASKDLIEACSSSEIVESSYINQEAFFKDFTALKHDLHKNMEQIKAKKKEPSIPIILTDTSEKIALINYHIKVANNEIKENNETFDNLALKKSELASQVWRRMLEDSKPIYNRYKKEHGDLDKAITSLQHKIGAAKKNLELVQKEIRENEREITSIRPTIDSVNKLLKSFGFTNFHLKESTNCGFYEVKRENGSDAKRTLSEGEKSFITFLYFYHLIDGSFSPDGSTKDKIVVFDDPVSSLDSDILFVVSNLIRTIFSKMHSNASSVKQVFVLTHNTYFHKEITFDKNHSAKKIKRDEKFWVIRKTSQRSEVQSCEDNPIKSSYELLWREVRNRPPSDTNIQNAMRRILEYYFKFLGNIRELCSKVTFAQKKSRAFRPPGRAA